jgi:hypothetical protein
MSIHNTAERWNYAYPPGTPVRVRLANGAIAEDRTAGQAEQWGSHALVTLQGRHGMWTTAVLEARPDAERDAA